MAWALLPASRAFAHLAAISFSARVSGRLLALGCVLLLALPVESFGQASTGALSAPEENGSDLTPTPPTWRGAITDSLRLLVIEHATRVFFQPKTRRELGGNFFSDYRRSLKTPQTWGDGDSWGVNYIGHPIHGAASGFVWLDHEDGSHDPKLGFFSAANDLAAKLASGVLPPEKAAVAPQLIFNQRLDGWLTLFFLAVVWFVIIDMLRISLRYTRGLPVATSSEAPYQVTRLSST